MKFVLRDLMLGDTLKGRIHEVLPEGDLVISFSGDLLRVQNETRRPLGVGDPVTLVVKAVGPLRFHLQPELSEQRRSGRLDVSI